MSENRVIHTKTYRIGILDSLPKLSNPEVNDDLNSCPAFMWWGAFRVVLKEPWPKRTPPPWIAEKNFSVVDNLDTEGKHFIVLDTTRDSAAIVYKGAYPAYRSLALLEPAKAWYHFGPTEDRYTLGVAVDILREFCSAIAIVVKFGPVEWIEVPMDTFSVGTPEEIRGLINQAYADRDEELQKNVASLV